MARGLINQSDEYRKLLMRQAEKYNIPFTWLCRAVRIDREVFKVRYLNVKDLSTSDTVSDLQLKEMGRLVGLDARVVIVIKDGFDEEAETIRIKLKDEYDNRKKERTAAETQ